MSSALLHVDLGDVKLDNFLYGGIFQDTIKLSDMGLAVKLPRSGFVKGRSS